MCVKISCMNPAINLVHLKFFYDAVVYESISEAAKMNYISQSAVSQAITKLETIFGVQLFFQNRQKLQVTDEGRIVFEQARVIFKAVQETFDKVNQSKNTLSGSIKFVSTNSLGLAFIASTYQKMREAYPEINISYQLGNLNLIRNALRQGDAEFAIVVDDPTFATFSKQTLIKGLFNLYQGENPPPKLIEKGILFDSKSSLNVDLLKDFLETQSCGFKVQAELSGWGVVAQFTEMNIGIGFLPEYILNNNRFPKIKKYPMELPRLEYEICAIYNKGTKLSQAAATFLEQFKAE